MFQRRSKEYLGELRLFAYGRLTDPPRVGQIVLIVDETRKRSQWVMGKITKVFPGKDQRIRVVEVCTSRGILLRPIQKLCPLEAEESFDSVESEKLKRATSNSSPLPAVQEGVSDEAQQSNMNSENSSQMSLNDCAIDQGTLNRKVSAPLLEVRTRAGRLVKPVQKLGV